MPLSRQDSAVLHLWSAKNASKVIVILQVMTNLMSNIAHYSTAFQGNQSVFSSVRGHFWLVMNPQRTTHT